MSDFTQQQLAKALEACATEPIHQIGHIQPVGVLLVLSADSEHRILQCSNNFAEFFEFAAGEILDKPLSELIGIEATGQVYQLIATAKIVNTAVGMINVRQTMSGLLDMRAHVCVSDEMFLLELERIDNVQYDNRLAGLLFDMQQMLLNSKIESEISRYFDQIATLVRALTGYDSVMIYRFDNNWDGEVISQSHDGAFPSYLGLQFPASDIPPQARRLYTVNLVRTIADIDAVPVPVLPALNPSTRHPLDMSYSALRSLSPVHIEYLRNMGAQASMTISLLQNGRLWGLIACHHLSPKRIPISLREDAIFISQMASAQLSSIEAIEQRKQFNKTIQIVSELLKYISTDAAEAILHILFPKLLDLQNASGMAMIIEGKLFLHGDVPSVREVNALIQWLSNLPVTEVFSSNYLSKQYPPAEAYPHLAAGLIATPLSNDMRNCIIWLRKEKPRTVKWAGKHEKDIVQDDAGLIRLTPRKSFAIWTEHWLGRSEPWSHVEIGIAGMLALALPEGLAHKSRLEQVEEIQKKVDSELRIAATTFESQEGLLVTDANCLILRVNRIFTHITGYTVEEVKGKNPSILKSGHQSDDFYRAMWASIQTTGTWEGEIWNKRKNGEIYPELLTVTSVKDKNGTVINYVGTLKDITKIKQHESEIEHAAFFDDLTQLPNRRMLADRIPQALARAKRFSEMACVAYLDLDGFKFINDTSGYSAGDWVLVEAAKRLLRCVRTEDTVARLGGDEFVLLLNGVTNRNSCERTLSRILTVMTIPFELNSDKSAYISVSIGYTLYPEDDVDADTLMRHADQAMYSAKQAGKNRYFKFDVRSATRSKANWAALARIQKALADREFCLYIQPKISLRTGEVAGAEALIRWIHPVRGLIQPSEFLPLIEDQDLAISVGDWVIKEGLALLREWSEQGLYFPLSVNVSPRQLRESNFSANLANFLKIYSDVPPERLEIEVVESAALDDIDQVSELISKCQSLGVGFSLDDFGTGYSSLTLLKRLGVETLKIDQTFVRDILKDESALAIVRGVIGLAEAFRSHTVAEGVENWEVAAKLKALGCEIAQGYAIARPMPSKEIPNWISHFRMPKID
jgi:diguanylate cyclase (GGDEF)-like protein/PAS domain S-box-containing protein